MESPSPVGTCSLARYFRNQRLIIGLCLSATEKTFLGPNVEVGLEPNRERKGASAFAILLTFLSILERMLTVGHNEGLSCLQSRRFSSREEGVGFVSFTDPSRLRSFSVGFMFFAVPKTSAIPARRRCVLRRFLARLPLLSYYSRRGCLLILEWFASLVASYLPCRGSRCRERLFGYFRRVSPRVGENPWACCPLGPATSVVALACSLSVCFLF